MDYVANCMEHHKTIYKFIIITQQWNLNLASIKKNKTDTVWKLQCDELLFILLLKLTFDANKLCKASNINKWSFVIKKNLLKKQTMPVFYLKCKNITTTQKTRVAFATNNALELWPWFLNLQALVTFSA